MLMPPICITFQSCSYCIHNMAMTANDTFFYFWNINMQNWAMIENYTTFQSCNINMQKME